MLCEKNGLRRLKSSELELPNGTKLYIIERLCSYGIVELM